MISTKKEKLKSLAEEIKQIEAKKKIIINKIIKGSQKTLKQWSTEIKSDKYKDAIRNLFVEQSNKFGGTDYFTWVKTPDIQKDFQNFFKKYFVSKDKYFFDGTSNRFFILKRFHMKCTSRSSTEMEYYNINKNDNLVYNYSGTAYHGFGMVDNSVQQVLTIDIDNLTVIDYTDSTRQYHYNDSQHHKINCDFINKFLKK